MIALIEFNNRFVLPKKEAISLGLRFTEEPEYVVSVSSWRTEPRVKLRDDYYVDDVYADGEGKYYKDVELTQAIPDYQVVTKILQPDNDVLVLVEKQEQLVDLDVFVPQSRWPFTIVRGVKEQFPSGANILGVLDEVEMKFKKIQQMTNAIASQQFNSRVNVHVGGGLIVTYNELLLKEDCCTDILQTELNHGWRIIAVCVQPDQRRPDYILGRYNPENDVKSTRAKREGDE